MQYGEGGPGWCRRLRRCVWRWQFELIVEYMDNHSITMAPIGPEPKRLVNPLVSLFFPTTEQDTTKFDDRATSSTTDCFCPGWACYCCPAPLGAASSACVRMLNPRVFSMTDWYIGSAGRWISVTFDQSEGTMIRKNHSFSRSILASEAVRVSRMRLISFAFLWGEVEASREVTFGMVVSYHCSPRAKGKQ